VASFGCGAQVVPVRGAYCAISITTLL